MALTIRIVGTILAVVFAAAGLSAASALFPLLVVVGLVVGLATYSSVRGTGGRFGPQQYPHDEDRGREGRGRDPRVLAGGGAALATVAGVYVLIGVVVLSGAAVGGLLLAAVLALVAHLVLRSRRVASGAPSGTASLPPAEHRPEPLILLLPDDASTATTRNLCRAWRVSYLVLENARDPGALAEVGAARRRYLDELERRDPEGFRRWLDAGARAASDPARYIRAESGVSDREDGAAA